MRGIEKKATTKAQRLRGDGVEEEWKIRFHFVITREMVVALVEDEATFAIYISSFASKHMLSLWSVKGIILTV